MGNATNSAYNLLHLGWWQLLDELAACCPRDALVHQGATEIVGSCLQTSFDAFATHLYPRDLNICNVGIEHQARPCVHQDSFTEGWSFARSAFPVDGSLHMHEGQGHKFGNAARAFLQL